MGIRSDVIGNLLANPEQRPVDTKNGTVRVTELRVMADAYKRDGDKLVQDEERSEPVQITIWNERLGDEIVRHFRKGCRIVAIGDQHINRWTDKESQEARYQVQLTADVVALVPYRIDSIVFREKQRNEQPAPEAAAAS